jgi:hypothetical protein
MSIEGGLWRLAMELNACTDLNRGYRPTYLAPGQRYARYDELWSLAEMVTILHVGQDAIGLTWVIYGGPDGDRSARPADHFEAAICRGEMVPITAGATGWC